MGAAFWLSYAEFWEVISAKSGMEFRGAAAVCACGAKRRLGSL